jgi:hypothetical protein
LQGTWQRFVLRIRSRTGQRWVAAIEIIAAIGLLRERTGYPDGKAMVILLALVAFASAAFRWHASRALRSTAPADAAVPVEPT